MSIHHMIRVPIAGPSPYNTLVYIGGTLECVGSLDPIPVPEPGKTGRASCIFRSQFQLIGYDPRSTPSEVPHSTAVWMNTLGPQQNCNFEAAHDMVRYAGFDPDPKNIKRDGTFYFVIDIAWNISRGLGSNCQQYGVEQTPDGQQVQVCVLYEFPFCFQVSSYVLVWEPAPPQAPGGWGGIHGKVPNKPARAEGIQMGKFLDQASVRQGKGFAASGPPSGANGCKCQP